MAPTPEIQKTLTSKIITTWDDTNSNGKLDEGEAYEKTTIFDNKGDGKYEEQTIQRTGRFVSIFNGTEQTQLAPAPTTPTTPVPQQPVTAPATQSPTSTVPPATSASGTPGASSDSFSNMINQFTTFGQNLSTQYPQFAQFINLFIGFFSSIVNLIRPLFNQTTPAAFAPTPAAFAPTPAAGVKTSEVPSAAFAPAPAATCTSNEPTPIAPTPAAPVATVSEAKSSVERIVDSEKIAGILKDLRTGWNNIDDGILKRFGCSAIENQNNVTNTVKLPEKLGFTHQNKPETGFITSLATEEELYIKNDKNYYRLAIVKNLGEGKYNIRYITFDKSKRLSKTTENRPEIEKYLTENLADQTINGYLKDYSAIKMTQNFGQSKKPEGFEPLPHSKGIYKKVDGNIIRLAIEERIGDKIYIRYANLEKKAQK